MWSRNIYLGEMRLTRRSFIGFGLALVAVLATFAAFTDLIISNEDLAGLLESYPQALLDAFNFDIAAFTSFEGWMGSEPYVFYVLLLSIFGILQALGSISKELDQRTGEFLFSQPVSRPRIFLSKVLSGLTQLTVLFLLSALVAWLAGHLAAEVTNPTGLFLLFAAGYLIAIGFSGIGYLLTPLFNASRSATALGIGIVLGSFVLDAFSKVSDKVNWLGYFSLFQLYDVHGLLAAKRLPLWPSLFVCILFVLGVGAGLWLFRQKDILH